MVVQTETFKIKKDKVKCEKCEYKCKKESTLRKHINTKHGDKECKENTKLQDSDTVWLNKINEIEELLLTQRVKDIKKSFVFSDSMLDKFLWRRKSLES